MGSSVSSSGDLADKLSDIDKSKSEIESNLMEKNATLLEMTEEWDQCEKKLKETKAWISKGRDNLESLQSKKRPIRDQINMREKMLSDITIQKKRADMALEKLKVHFREEITTEQDIQKFGKEISEDLNVLSENIKEQCKTLESCLTQLDQYQQEIGVLRQQILACEGELRTVSSPAYTAKDRDKALVEQSVSVDDLKKSSAELEEALQKMSSEDLDSQYTMVQFFLKSIAELEIEADRIAKKLSESSNQDIDIMTLSASVTGCKTQLVSIHTMAENHKTKMERCKSDRKRRIQEIKKYQTLLIDLEQWLGESQSTISTEITLTSVKVVRDQITASEILEEELRTRTEQLKNMIEDIGKFQGYSDVEPLVEDMQSNLGTLYEVMQDAQQCLALKLKNLQDALIKMESNPPITSDTNIDTTTNIDSIDEITIDELEIADESLKSINISFDSKSNEQFQIQPPSIDNTAITIVDFEPENFDQTETEEHTQITHYIGKLRLIVEKGMDLEKKDLFQKSDPYVKVIFGQQASKSKKVKNTLNPVWNHEVVLELDKSTPMEIKIEVNDWDRFGKDNIMGFAKLNLDEEMPKNQHGTYSIPLEDCKSGKIYLSLKFDGEIVKSQRIIKGVRDLKKYLTEGQVDESKTIIKKTTTSKHVIKKTIIAEDGSKNIIEENAKSSADIKTENPKEAEKEKENDKNNEWTNIPIIRLDNLPSGVEIQELSDEEQNEPIDLTNKLLVEGVVTTPSDEESVQETIEIEEITDDEPIDLTVKHKPLSTESSLSSNSSVITVLEVEK